MRQIRQEKCEREKEEKYDRDRQRGVGRTTGRRSLI